MYIHMYIYIYIYIYYMYIYVCIYIYMHIYINIYIYIYIYIYENVNIYRKILYTNKCIYIYIYVLTNTLTRSHLNSSEGGRKTGLLALALPFWRLHVSISKRIHIKERERERGETIHDASFSARDAITFSVRVYIVGFRV